MADATYPDDLRYDDGHGWVRVEGDSATLGVTWHAQDSLGEIISFEPPEIGSAVSGGSAYAEVESTKAASDLVAPISGVVTAVNDALDDAPEKINEDPYGEGWTVKITLSDPGDAESLLSAAGYREMLGHPV